MQNTTRTARSGFPSSRSECLSIQANSPKQHAPRIVALIPCVRLVVHFTTLSIVNLLLRFRSRFLYTVDVGCCHLDFFGIERWQAPADQFLKEWSEDVAACSTRTCICQETVAAYEAANANVESRLFKQQDLTHLGRSLSRCLKP